MELIDAIKYVLNQHDGGCKLPDLMEDLCSMKEEGLISECEVTDVLDAVERDNDLDYLIYEVNRHFVFELP